MCVVLLSYYMWCVVVAGVSGQESVAAAQVFDLKAAAVLLEQEFKEAALSTAGAAAGALTCSLRIAMYAVATARVACAAALLPRFVSPVWFSVATHTMITVVL
jgi:hypothetical protein